MTGKELILRDLEHARAAIHVHMSETSRDWSPRAIFSRSVQRHRWIWIAAAAVGGLAIARLVKGSASRKNERDIYSKPATNRTLAAWLAAPLAGIARKAAVSYITARIKDLIPSPKDQTDTSPTDFS